MQRSANPDRWGVIVKKHQLLANRSIKRWVPFSRFHAPYDILKMPLKAWDHRSSRAARYGRGWI